MVLRIYGNRPLKTLPGQETRPTAARVREALFNIWPAALGGCCWLDLCAGNGVMGAEALCRGAQGVVGIERSPRACRVIRHNWQQVSQPGQTYQVLQGDVLAQLSRLRGQQFDYIYFDPPYHSQLYGQVLQAVVAGELLTPQGELVAEHDHQWQPQPLPGLHLSRQKHYGRTGLAFFQRLEASSP